LCVVKVYLILDTEFSTQLENTIRLSDDIAEQAQRRSDLLHTALDVATKISDGRMMLINGLKDAREAIAQCEASSETIDAHGLSKRQDDLQV